MSASNETTVLPNPNTPLAFLSPEDATRAANHIYSAVGSLAVLIWDILLHLPQDYKLFKQTGVRFSLIVYSIARVTSLAYATGMVIVQTAPIGNCDMIRRVSLLYPFTIPLTVLLFVIRVSALYNNNKYIIAFFSMTWLSVLAACIAVPIGVLGVQLGPSKHCIEDKTDWAATLIAFCPFIHDGLIFVATAWALMRRSHSDVNVKNGFKVMVLGDHLPAFSKSVLRDGQAYFLGTLILNLFFIATFYIPDSVIAPCPIVMPLFVIINNMSSYVYRNIRFGVYRDYTITTSVIDKGVSHQPHPPIVFKSTVTTKHSGRKIDIGGVEAGYAEGDFSSVEKKICLEKVQTYSIGSGKDMSVNKELEDVKEV